MERSRYSRFKLLLTVLIISHLIVCSRAVPCTRTQGLAQKSLAHQHLGSIGQTAVVESPREEEETAGWRRMDLELNDYPGSGANNRHIPKPPGRK